VLDKNSQKTPLPFSTSIFEYENETDKTRHKVKHKLMEYREFVQATATSDFLGDNQGRHEQSELAEQTAKHARWGSKAQRSAHVKEYVQIIVKLKHLNIDTIQQSYTL